jgi:hypothetical protein
MVTLMVGRRPGRSANVSAGLLPAAVSCALVVLPGVAAPPRRALPSREDHDVLLVRAQLQR